MQASSFRYNLVQNPGQLNDVYGVIDSGALTNPISTSRTAATAPETRLNELLGQSEVRSGKTQGGGEEVLRCSCSRTSALGGR